MNWQTYYVDGAAALDEVCARIRNKPWLALDTEFIRESTYYPRLCLLQLATDDVIACIDPLALAHLDPLAEILFDPAVIKVFHACSQDMEIFYHAYGRLPGPVFDTQLAAPLLGMQNQPSYASVVQELLGTALSKSHTRTDWCRRPLSPAQIEYALDDVRYLGPLYLKLRAQLEQRGRLAWLQEDFAALSDPARYRNPPELAWRRIRATGKLTGRRLATLKSLAAWREERARREDRPRGWILTDEALVDIARMGPDDAEQLASLRSVKRQAVQDYGSEILALVLRAKAAPAGGADTSPAGERAGPLDPHQEALADIMMALVRVRGAENAINPAMLASRDELARVILGERDTEVLHGWKKSLIGDDLLLLLAGQLRLRIVDGTPGFGPSRD
ncbi:MAG: ribonuclease D [Gammaproteobacteria bacterium]